MAMRPVLADGSSDVGLFHSVRRRAGESFLRFFVSKLRTREQAESGGRKNRRSLEATNAAYSTNPDLNTKNLF